MTTKEDDDQAFEEAMDDVHTRFILNLPDEELQSAPRIFFQLEQAWWFYDDFIYDGAVAAAAEAAAAADGGGGGGKKKNKKKQPEPLPRFKHVKPFALAMFKFSPLLSPMLPEFEEMYEEFNTYKRSISTYGTILLNKDATKVALCRVYKGKAWTLPGGKVNQNESGKDASSRETYEETGFDPQAERGICEHWREQRERGEVVEELMQDDDDIDAPSDEEEEGGKKLLPWEPLQDGDKLVYTENDTKKRRTCYVCRGVPEDFPFEPVARKEVSEVAWHELSSLPKTTYAVLPFMAQLRKWIKRDNRKRGIENRGTSRAGSRPKQKDYTSTPTILKKRDGDSRGKPHVDLEDIGLTPFFSDDGNAPWEENASEKKKGGKKKERTEKKDEKSKECGVPPSPSNKKDKQKKQKRPNSRSGSRSGSRGRQVEKDDPLVASALASPGERDRWTEDEMFATNEQIMGRKITYDGNPHDFAEKGFDVVGEGRVDPHAFRVVGGTFMNSNAGGQLSAPPGKDMLQPLMNAQGTSRSGGFRGSGGAEEGLADEAVDDGLGLTPFFSDDGKAPWEEGAMGGMLAGLHGGRHVTPPSSVRSAQMTGQSNSKGLALLNRLRQGAPANEEGSDGGVILEREQKTQSPTLDKIEKKKDKKRKSNKKATDDVGNAARAEKEDSTDWFMTDKEITARSQMDKLSILPPPAAPAQRADGRHDEHLEWMKHWVQRLPQTEPTIFFGDFRLDANAIMNAMAIAQS